MLTNRPANFSLADSFAWSGAQQFFVGQRAHLPGVAHLVRSARFRPRRASLWGRQRVSASNFWRILSAVPFRDCETICLGL